MSSFIARASFLLALTGALFGFTHWAADGFDPLLFTPVRGDGHPAWIIEPSGAMVLGSAIAAYVYVVLRHELVPRQRWVFVGAVTCVTVFLALWPDIYGTLRFGTLDVIEWQVNGWLLPGLHGAPRWLSAGLLQFVLVWLLAQKNGEQGDRSVGPKGSGQ
jgi:uncharacterized membrane protein